MHEHHSAFWPLAAAVLLIAYLVAVPRAGERGWSRWRVAAWCAGCLVVALGAALTDHGDPRAHMARHVLLGMLAPLGLVLGAPVTLLLRAAPRSGRVVARVLRSRPLHVLGHPVTAALLSTGGLVAVMSTPLRSTGDPTVHLALDLHYLAAGYLFAWSIAGPDPAPRRPGPITRVVVLVLAAAAHAVLAKHLYAGAADEEGRAAALLMYYGGDVAEVLLATALFADWYRRRAPGRAAGVGRAAGRGRWAA